MTTTGQTGWYLSRCKDWRNRMRSTSLCRQCESRQFQTGPTPIICAYVCWYGSVKRYEFQLVKSIILKIDPATGDEDYIWTFNGETVHVVTESMHVRVLRSASKESTAVVEDIKKAIRILYSLMPSGCQGHNGVDPETSIYIPSPDICSCDCLWNRNLTPEISPI